VTRNDYETLIMTDYPYLDAVRVWGGEDHDPPTYGKIFVAAKPTTGLSLSELQKSNLVSVLESRNVVSLEVEVLDPDFIKLVVSSNVRYDSNLTTKSENTIKSEVIQEVEDFNDTEINDFDSKFRYSKLVAAIDDVDQAILSNSTTIKL
jgi:hypothetical protein